MLPIFTLRFSSVCGDELLSHAGSGSGGYLHHVFTYAAKQLFGEEVKELTYKTLRFARLYKLCLFTKKTKSCFSHLHSCSMAQEQRLPGGETGERWGSSAVLCCNIRISQHSEPCAETEKGKIPVPFCRSYGLSIRYDFFIVGID